MAILKDNRAFGLIEALISIAVFSLIAVTGTASIVSVIDSNQVSQNSNSVVTNLNIALEEMAREIRTGSDYKVSEDGTEITFKPDRGCDDACITYRFNRALQTVEKQNSELAEVSFVPIIASEVKVEEMNFSLIKREVEDATLNPLVYGNINFEDIHFANRVMSYDQGEYVPACISSYKDPESALGSPNYPGSNRMTVYMCRNGTLTTYPDPLNPTSQLPKPNDGVYSLGRNGELVLNFPKYLTNSGNTDNDVWIFETGTLLEIVDIYGKSVDSDEWVFLGTTATGGFGGIDIDQEIGLAEKGTVAFSEIKIVDKARQCKTKNAITGICEEYRDVDPPLVECERDAQRNPESYPDPNDDPRCDAYKNFTGADIDAVGIIHTKPRPDQPGVLLKIKGYSQTREANRSDFFLQTLISQRVTE